MTPEYWEVIYKVSAITGILGLIASVLAAIRAGNAEKAAEKAGDVVTLQKIIYEIMEITRSCELNKDISIYELHNKYGNINVHIMGIIGLFEERPELVEKDIIITIQDNLLLLYNELNIPVDFENNKVPQYTYNRFIALFNQLSGSLGKLKGKIDGKLLKSNK